MGYEIKCDREGCGKSVKVANIVDLIRDHTDEDGYFPCSDKNCNGKGYIKKEFALQEKGKQWRFFIVGVIPLSKNAKDTYQPYIFLCSYQNEGDTAKDLPRGKATDAWFCYYKDLREEGGKLKHGHGPGGPPVLQIQRVKDLVVELAAKGL